MYALLSFAYDDWLLHLVMDSLFANDDLPKILWHCCIWPWRMQRLYKYLAFFEVICNNFKGIWYLFNLRQIISIVMFCRLVWIPFFADDDLFKFSWLLMKKIISTFKYVDHCFCVTFLFAYDDWLLHLVMIVIEPWETSIPNAFVVNQRWLCWLGWVSLMVSCLSWASVYFNLRQINNVVSINLYWLQINNYCCWWLCLHIKYVAHCFMTEDDEPHEDSEVEAEAWAEIRRRKLLYVLIYITICSNIYHHMFSLLLITAICFSWRHWRRKGFTIWRRARLRVRLLRLPRQLWAGLWLSHLSCKCLKYNTVLHDSCFTQCKLPW
jgi:hypothetical protein